MEPSKKADAVDTAMLDAGSQRFHSQYGELCKLHYAVAIEKCRRECSVPENKSLPTTTDETTNHGNGTFDDESRTHAKRIMSGGIESQRKKQRLSHQEEVEDPETKMAIYLQKQSERNKRAISKDEEADPEVQKLTRGWYSTFNDDLRTTLEAILKLARDSVAKGEVIDLEKIEEHVNKLQLLRKVCNAKYNKLWLGVRTVRAEQGLHPETIDEVKERIRGPEELKYPWAVSDTNKLVLPNDGLLMRITDEASKAKSYPDIGFLSGGTNADLTTFKGRQQALKLHLDFCNRKPTVFISTTANVKDFEKWHNHYVKRDGKKPSRCTIKLSFINGNARLAEGWPILRAVDQIKHYKTQQEGPIDSFYHNEFLLPFRCGAKQIVGTYCWKVVQKFMADHSCNFQAWYEKVVIPAFREHEAARREGRKVENDAGCVCCGH